MDMSQKVREGKHQHIGHHGLIKVIVVNALNKLRIHVLWSKFIDMDREAFIDTQTLTPDETLSSSVRGRKGKVDEEYVMKPAQEKIEKLDQRLRIQPLQGDNVLYIT